MKIFPPHLISAKSILAPGRKKSVSDPARCHAHTVRPRTGEKGREKEKAFRKALREREERSLPDEGEEGCTKSGGEEGI